VEEELSGATQLLSLAEPRDFLDPELPITAGGVPLGAPGPELFVAGGGAREPAVDAVHRALAMIAQGRWPPAWNALAGLPARARTDGGRDITLLMGYAAYKALDLERARDLLSPLAEDPAYASRRPAAAYYVGRALYGTGSFREGLAKLEEFRRAYPALAREAIETRLPPSRDEKAMGD
jgi:hypothetical protein